MAEKIAPEVKKAREALAARYDERNMTDAARAVRAGDWDNEPFMKALVDVQTP